MLEFMDINFDGCASSSSEESVEDPVADSGLFISLLSF